MTGSPPVSGYEAGLLVAAERDATLRAVELSAAPLPASEFARRFPDRYRAIAAGRAELEATLGSAGGAGPTIFVRGNPAFLLDEGLGTLVRAVVVPRANVKIVADRARDPTRAQGSGLDGASAMRSLPGVSVVAPADDAGTRAAVSALATYGGPAYLALPGADAPAVTPDTAPFTLGRAAELRAGTDLAVLSYGRLLPRALALADDLLRVGVAARVLDLASLKPLDEAAVLRAARDTGALLVIEPAPLATGVGTFVAALTAENYPVPVRRIGYADAWPGGETDAALDADGLSAERLRDEAWELLRLRGKVQ